MRDEGYDCTPSSVADALDAARLGDLLFWAGRYALFVQWSPDGSHPWDAAPGAGAAVELEVGVAPGTADPVVLLGGVPLRGAEFRGGALRLRDPVVWATPDGGEVPVFMELQARTYAGEGAAGERGSGGRGRGRHAAFSQTANRDSHPLPPLQPTRPLLDERVLRVWPA